MSAQQPMTYRERREAKADRLREWADKREQKADAAYEGVQSITERIPFGQPILVGHHSERGARADQRRIESGMDRFCEHNSKASEMRSKAENIERQAKQAIYSDDADAVERLAEKLAKLEGQREHVKATNSEYKKAHRAELKALPSAFQRDRALPFPSYVLTNLSGNITRTRKRLEALKAQQTTPEAPRVITAKYAGECCECGAVIERGDMVRYWRSRRAVACHDC